MYLTLIQNLPGMNKSCYFFDLLSVINMSFQDYLTIACPFLGEPIQEYINRTGTNCSSVMLYLRVRYFVALEDGHVCSDKLLFHKEKTDYLGGKKISAYGRVSVDRRLKTWRYIDVYNIMCHNPPYVNEKIHNYFERLVGIGYKIETRILLTLFYLYDIKIESLTSEIKPLIGNVITQSYNEKNVPKLEITMNDGQKRLVEFNKIQQIYMDDFTPKYKHITKNMFEKIKNIRPSVGQKFVDYYRIIGGKDEPNYHRSLVKCIKNLYPDIGIKPIGRAYVIVRKDPSNEINSILFGIN